jgi:glycerophosphoryl diester phosphodiesterase
VGDSTLAELLALEAGSHFRESFRGEPIPTLKDVFEKIGTRIYYNIELTNYASPLDTLPELVAELVAEYNLEKYILFSSFNPLALIRVRQKIPRAPIGLLAMPGGGGRLPRSPFGYLLGYQALHVEKSDAIQPLVDKIHRRRRKINVYTVNAESDMESLFLIGVDGIFTDDPPLARRVLANIDKA